jgi:uncharacterized membrane protein
MPGTVTALWRIPAGRVLIASVLGLAVATAVGMAVLWPSGPGRELPPDTRLPTNTESAKVERVIEKSCADAPGTTCRTVEFRLQSGPEEGRVTSFELEAPPPLDPEIGGGDSIRVVALGSVSGVERSYVFAGFDRRPPMVWLALAFAALVVLFGRFRGAMSLVGLTSSLVIVLVFIVPAIGDGEPALAVAIVGSLAVMLATISLAHGLGVKSLTAMLGTGASLLLVALLALVFTNAAHFTGVSSDQATTLSYGLGISLEGLILAGTVIGALGVLDDITVSQASTVLALRAANPDLHARSLYARATEVGRDHVSAAVNTLVLAYAGAALPVLLIFTARGIGFGEALNFEIVARQVVAMGVGSIGLIAAVPLTTGLASLLAVRLPGAVLPDSDAGHVGHAH